MASTPRSTSSVRSPGYSSAAHPDSLPNAARFLTYTSPVSMGRNGATSSRSATLPLSLVAMIVAYVDDVGDIARVCRTSKLLYYMAIPQLYQRVSLHAYPEIRYVNGRPEGFGGASPFTMALNGLVTQTQAQLVEEFRLWGEWREDGLDEYVQGRVPDNCMMLNTLVRAATDRMPKLRAFHWELNSKPLKTVYLGLAARPTLTTLTIQFPSTRVPRPSITIPPMPNLRAFKATGIDPLCHPDDISLMLLQSKKLVDLRLHFSPRMRQEAEPTLNLNTYFGLCQKAHYVLPLRHLALQNFFGIKAFGLEHVFDPDTCKSVVFLDTFGGVASAPRNVFVDDTWKDLPPDLNFGFRTARFNDLSRQHATIISRATGLERLYIVGPSQTNAMTGSDNDVLATTCTTSTSNTPSKSNSGGPTTPSDGDEMMQLGRAYIHALTRHHGSTLKHLLLSDQWALTPEDITELIRFCPNLEQLGMAVGDSDPKYMRLLMSFLPNLQGVRVLSNTWIVNHLQTATEEEMVAQMSQDLANEGADRLKYISVADLNYKMGNLYEITTEDGSVELRREVARVGREEMEHVEIWGLDYLNVDVDPLAPFDP